MFCGLMNFRRDFKYPSGNASRDKDTFQLVMCDSLFAGMGLAPLRLGSMTSYQLITPMIPPDDYSGNGWKEDKTISYESEMARKKFFKLMNWKADITLPKVVASMIKSYE